MEERNQGEKRKLQNRIAQRRFRSRRKGYETVLLLPDQENTESLSGSGDQPSALPGAAQHEFQGFGGDIDFSSMMTVNNPEDLFADVSGTFTSTPWLRSPYILSPPSEDADPTTEWKGNDSLGSDTDAAAHVGMGCITDSGRNTAKKSTLAECLPSPDSIFAAMKNTSSALATAEPAQLYAVTNCSPAAHSAPAINDHDSQYPITNTYAKPRNKRGSMSASRKAKCCVAHKAELMVSDLQKIYSYGVYFGFLEAQDNEVEECLSFLKTKLKDMANCHGGDAGVLSSSDSDVK